ncbi:DUF6544 family protein [Ferrimonas pelagia]|uniref:Uncharacterized protein n=1 Tax=Ferrimonas pelagia TaxID=1177826 RepID=A0ABP9EY62_9GAMM
MMTVLAICLSLLGLAVALLLCLRWFDGRAEHAEWARLLRLQPHPLPLFDPQMVSGLPEPAQRLFNFAITPGTPLAPVVEIHMEGQFSLGTQDAPNYQAMKASQLLACPHGFIWRMTLPGRIPVSGSDSGTWTRFRILGLLPVARMGGNPDHERSAFGRYVAESVFWAPAALLPAPGVHWKAVDADTARITISRGHLSQAVDIKVDLDGRPVEVSLMRWSDANPEKTYRLQPFGGTLSDFREVQGYHLPFRIDAGNLFGTKDYFAFFKAEVSEIRFPGFDDKT